MRTTKMTYQFLRIATALLAAAVSCLSIAQTATDHWSLEALASQARVVFKGRVTDVSRLELDTPPGQPARVRISLTVAVDDRLKGNSDRWMTLDRETLASDTRFDLWKKSDTPLLWFVFSEDDPRPFPGSTEGPGLPLQPGRSWSAIHLTAPEAAEIAIDKFASQVTYSASLSTVKESKDKLDAVAAFLKANTEPTKVRRLRVPVILAKIVGRDSGDQNVVVPITPDLETMATKMVSAPDSFLPKDHSASDKTVIRSSGIRALASFNNETNVALVKSLLNDPAKGPSTNTGTAVKTHYWVRLAAYDVLTFWGIQVPKPALSD